ncbi:acyl-coenzyme A synthetase ACSM5, mitochondrial-like [Morus bassanus]
MTSEYHPVSQYLSFLIVKHGVFVIPGTPQLTAKDILHRLQASKPKYIFTNDTLSPAEESVMPDCQLSRYNITPFCSAPTGYRMLVQHDLSRTHSKNSANFLI